MIDSLHWALRTPTDALARFGLERQRYALVTMHRPANVDTITSLRGTLAVLRTIAARIRVVFPMHPRTAARVDALGLTAEFRNMAGLVVCDPLGYNDFVTLMANAGAVATDSGGVQEETTALGVPCLTLRNGTERPITVELGTNVVVGMDCERIETEIDSIASGRGKRGRVPDGWDGNAAIRIVDELLRLVSGDPPPLTAGPRA
jgi:UDP-N-acetylglucosamine 2-epimerase (non-hydrolysing)